MGDLEPFEGKCAFGRYEGRIALVGVDRTHQTQPTIVFPEAYGSECLKTWLLLLAKNPLRSASPAPLGQPDDLLRILGVASEDRLIRDGASGMVAFFHNQRADYVAVSRMRPAPEGAADQYESERITLTWDNLSIDRLTATIMEKLR